MAVQHIGKTVVAHPTHRWQLLYAARTRTRLPSVFAKSSIYHCFVCQRIYVASRLFAYCASSDRIHESKFNPIELPHTTTSPIIEPIHLWHDCCCAGTTRFKSELRSLGGKNLFLQFAPYVQSAGSVHQGIVIDIETRVNDRPRWYLRQNKGIYLP
jgi:hypothetical protein